MAPAHPPQTLSMTKAVLSTVKPLKRTAHVEIIDPTLLDMTVKDIYIPVFFAYRLKSKSEDVYYQFLNKVKESLRKVLVPFFPFAGLWIATPSGCRLLCNDAGVPFFEAYVDKDLDTVVLASADFQPVPELQGYHVLRMDDSQFRARMRPEGLPSLFVQVTRFKCGGIVLAVTFNHTLTDGKGFYNFMTAWSDIARTNETTVKMEHNRAMITESYPHLKLSNEARPDVPYRKIDMWEQKSFQVSASAIKALKQEAKDSKEGAFVSTVDCITAHIWKSVSRIPSSVLGEQKVLVSSTVEGRSRFFDPPLPNMCGNFLSQILAPALQPNEVQDLPLASLALKLREELQTRSRETWFSPQRMMEFKEAIMSSKVAAMVVSSWFGFPMYEIDFGFGKPFFSPGPNSFAGLFSTSGTVILPPIPGDSSSAAMVSFGSTPEITGFLVNDPEFLSLFLPSTREEMRNLFSTFPTIRIG